MLPDTEANILNVLQLYEYSMSIGKSLDYDENCNEFLRLILKRKNLNACWILRKENDHLESQYAIPNGKKVRISGCWEVHEFLRKVKKFYFGPFSKLHRKICPVDIKNGYLCIHSLGDEGYLFLYSKQQEIQQMEILKLSPVIDKFSNTLKACRIFESQQKILHKLEESNEELNNYAHIVSHDLKSPIRNVETMVSWLEDEFSDKLQGNGEKYLDLIRENITKMEGLISDILTYSSIGMQAQSYLDVDAQALIELVLQHNFIPDHISIEIPGALPILKGDKLRLQQLFQNLITNAIKYNNKENGMIKIRYQDLDDHHYFSISDNGIGIEKKYHHKIFQTFQKLHHYKDSSGVGLSIVKRIVKNYGGKIWLESEPGVGTTFFFTLKKDPTN